MTRRLWSACLGAAALAAVLSVSARAAAKPPDLPMNQNDTVQTTPLSSPPQTSDGYEEGSKPDVGGCMIYSGGYSLYPSKVEQEESAAEQDKSAANLVFALRVYDALPSALPTPTAFQLRPTARRALAGSLLFGLNPLMTLLPTDKVLDTPDDHPQRVAGDDIFSDMPCYFSTWGYYVDWSKWIMSHWAALQAGPAPEQNEGYICAIHPITDLAAVTEVEAPAEIDSPLVPTAEALHMPKEDKPHKKKHKKHHPKGERLPMPQEDTTEGMTCPYLRQQAADRHACQFADPQIGRDVLDNLESLTMADKLLEVAEEFAQAGHICEALECCALAQDLCPGSPCADRAEGAMLDLYVRACEPATSPEATTDASKTAPGVEQQVNGLMKACRLLMNEGLHEQAAELARQAFAMDPERVMADPLIYKMHLLATTPRSAGSSESSEPSSCPYCQPIGKPIPGIVPDKKKTEHPPTTLLVPPMPPIDYEVVPALDRVLTETAEKAKPAGAEETSEEEASSSLDELIEAMMGGPGQMLFGFGVNADGSWRVSGEQTVGANVYHVLFSKGCLAIWKTPDAAKIKP
jgi:hypothetical protein